MKRITIVFILFCSSALFAQKSVVDSLFKLYQNEKYDTAKVKDLNNLAEELNNEGLADSAYNCAMRSIALNNSIKDWPYGPFSMTYSYSAISNIYFYDGKHKASRAASLKALDIALKHNYKARVARLLKDIADTFEPSGEYERSIFFYEKSLKMSQALGSRKEMGDCYNNMGGTYNSQGNNAKAKECFTKAMELYQQINYTKGIALANSNLGQISAREGKYEEAMNYYLAAVKIQEKEPGAQNKLAVAFANIGELYFNQKNYSKALEYHTKGLELKKKINLNQSMCVSYEAMGHIAFANGDTALAMNYYSDGLKSAKETDNTFVYGKILIDVGKLNFESQKTDEALKYYKEAQDIFVKMNNSDGMSVAYDHLVSVYIRQKNYKEAEICAKKQLAIMKENTIDEHIHSCYFKLTEIYSLTGNYKEAYEYYKLYSEASAKRFNAENTQKMTELDLNYKFEKKQAADKAEHDKKEAMIVSENSRKQILSISFIAILLLALIILILFVNRQKLKAKTDKIIYEQQEALLLSEKNKAEEELSAARRMLDSYTENLIQKSQIIEDFKEEIEKLNNLKSKELYTEKIEQLDSLNKLTILTTEDWDKFKELFEQVHKGFFVRLKDKFPDLTNAEIRLICLTKLNIDTKQMANMLGISPDTVTKTRYRLKKKIDLQGTEDLDVILKNI